ncbi:MAG: DNA polymerase I, partial [Phycisphaerales bacterium]|nr:DNA polymerase I [Phycisphaerales bacterium]
MSSSSGSGNLYLIDGYAQFFRAYHAIRTPMSSPVTSEPTHMTFGFVGMLLRLLRNHAPEHLALVLDVAGDRGTFRSQLYPEYKANRDPPPSDLRPQVDRCLELLGHLKIPVYGVEEVEADDVIATIVREMKGSHPELDITIVSKDKDLQQLLADRVTMLNLRKDPDPDEVIDTGWLAQQRGITPDQVVDMLALMGDTADNVPGVPGIGPKTAAQLIAAYGSVAGIYEQIDSETELAASKKAIKGKRLENLLASREDLPLSQELVTLKDDCQVEFDLDATKVDPATMDGEAIINALRELGFNRLKEEMRSWLLEASGEAPATQPELDLEAAGSLFGNLESGPIEKPVDGTYEIITDLAALDSLCEDLSRADRLAIDTETDGLVAPVVPLAGICVSSTPGTGFYVPVNAPEGTEILDQDVVLDRFRPILENPDIPKFGHNLKFDINVLRNHGIRLAGIAGDTMVESYVDDATRASHSMDALAERFLDRLCVPISAIIGRGKSQIVFSQAALDLSGPYAAEDADVTLQLEDRLRPLLDDKGFQELYEQTELPLVQVLAELEFNGIKVDADELELQRSELAVDCDRLRQEIINAAPHPFNPDSPKQLAAALFNDVDQDPPGLGITPIKKGKTGPSTDAEVLEKLSMDPGIQTEIPGKIIEYRQLTKLINTYLESLKTAIQPETGRIHASFNQTGTATGRLSSSDPNLQNIPIRTEIGRRIRRAFIAEEGHLLLAADYSQIELRILAHLSRDEGLITAFKAGADIHTAVAAEVFEVDPDEVTSEQRNGAKMVNFGIVYGITPFGLARRLGGDTPVARAAEIIDDYKAR